MRFYEIPKSTFDGLVTESGLLLKNFDIEAAMNNAESPGFVNDDIICATTGGINVTLTPTYSDMGSDVDNCPLNMMELKHLDSWEAKISATGLGVTAQNIKDSLGVADIDTNGNKVTPRMSLSQSDFQSIWWVSDKANGGFVAVKLDNALSNSGLSLQTGKNTKGQTTLEFTGHVSINAQNVVPMTFYSIDPGWDIGDITVSPESSLTNVFEVPVSDLQTNVSVNGNAITGTLKYMDEDNAITRVWGYGNFLVLKFTDIDADATSVKVGLEPSMGSGLVEIIDDPDKNGVFKITNKNTQKFKVVASNTTGSHTQIYDLTGLTLETE